MSRVKKKRKKTKTRAKRSRTSIRTRRKKVRTNTRRSASKIKRRRSRKSSPRKTKRGVKTRSRKSKVKNPKVKRSLRKKRGEKLKISRRYGFKNRKRELQDGRFFLEHWSSIKFDPPVAENFIASDVEEWVKVKAVPEAETYFNKHAPNEFIFARVFVKCRFFHKRGIEEAWGPGLRLPMHELTWENISMAIEMLTDSLQGLRPFVMQISIAFTTLPRFKNVSAFTGKYNVPTKIRPTKRKSTRRKPNRRVRHRSRARVSRRTHKH